MLKWHTSGNTAAWLRIPITSSQLIPIAAGKGFKFHHAEGNHSVLCLWMDPATESMLPRFATHQVGVAGVFVLCIGYSYRQLYCCDLLLYNITICSYLL